jgi:type VI secretion system protein ImpL
VLGTNTKAIYSSAEINNLIKQTRFTYTTKYLATWDNLWTTLKIGEFKNFGEAVALFSALAETNSFLWQLLQSAQINTTFSNNEAPDDFVRTLSDKFVNLKLLDLAHLQKEIKNLAGYFIDIAKNSEFKKAAFFATTTHLANLSKENKTKDPLIDFHEFSLTAPEIIRPLLQSLANNSWQVLLDTSRDYLNQIWTTTVYPEFQKNLNNTYPIFSTSNTDASLVNFTQFFGPSGIMENFFVSYLKPFVDTSQMYWTWKTIDGTHLNFSQSTLEMFIRAALIQKMFFSNQQNILSTKFTLVPTGLTPDTKKFTLNLDGQVITYTNGAKKSDVLMWPGPKPGIANIEFITKAGQPVENKYTGPWAWFKLLEKANLHADNDTTNYELIFDLNGNAVKYQLIPDQLLNPFLPEIVTTFRCNEELK